ncbi:hypothetical protein CW304_19495 [Bacillus sp. UFRGS-B20]|nr:hypothetical protein CW304_19495 [Bacillus sp. UFRGS-B20]
MHNSAAIACQCTLPCIYKILCSNWITHLTISHHRNFKMYMFFIFTNFTILLLTGVGLLSLLDDINLPLHLQIHGKIQNPLI